MNTPPTYIVAEVSTNWRPGNPAWRELLSERFEHVINVNHARGYRLLDFRLSQVMTGDDTLNETIIAVFTRTGASAEEGAPS